MDERPMMRDSESDFLYRYDWGRGEREMKPVIRRARYDRIAKSLTSTTSPSLQNKIMRVAGLSIGILIGLSLILAFFGTNAEHASISADMGDRLTAVETHYNVDLVQVSDSEGIDKPLRVVLNHNGVEVKCGLPGASDLNNKVALNCDDGVNVTAK
jgi:hypothetical protein